MTSEPVGWREAARQALYGPGGFFTREAPADHFRTSVHASPLFAHAVAALLRRVDGSLGRPETLDLVDMGAGRGELLSGVLGALDAEASEGDGGLLRRLRVRAVELGPRPGGLDPRGEWQDDLPGPGTVNGLLIANAWQDKVPVDVVENGADGNPRLVLTDTAANATLGGPPGPRDAAWLARWWPLEDAGPGARAEVGHPRDEAWCAAVRTLRRGVAVAADYGHTAGTRPPFGTLTGFRAGRDTAPVPDGTGDLTAHVALDAVAEAVAEEASAASPEADGGRPETEVELFSQREALRALGVTGSRPPLTLASDDPAAYVQALASAGEAAELTDPRGLGAFGWLVCSVGTSAPLP